MNFAHKTLWVENLDDQADEDRVLAHALAMGGGGVAIRTTSNRLPMSISRFRQNGLQVYAWRWPAVVQNRGGRYAIDEAKYVAEVLIPAGLNGYIVDPESEGDGGYNDWNRTDLALKELATSFCESIRTAAHGQGNASFLFGMTSGGSQPASRKTLPWKQFVSASDVVFPQIYWRARDKNYPAADPPRDCRHDSV